MSDHGSWKSALKIRLRKDFKASIGYEGEITIFELRVNYGVDKEWLLRSGKGNEECIRNRTGKKDSLKEEKRVTG